MAVNSLWAAASLATATATATTTIDLANLGKIRANKLTDGTIEALNIPFAKPPVGNLRFRRPLFPSSWTGIRDATQLGPGCIQVNASFPVDEDCLQLNVWSPAVASDEKLPVLVWAFGGGLTTGSGRTYNGTLLANLGRMVVVTVNYRVGALGFYASSEQQAEDQATGGLNGVLDILHALRFVHKHIPSFHGDAKRVALSGESSGSVGSCLLAFTPHAQGLFHRLILESGACTGPWMGPDPSRSGSFLASQTFADGVNCTGTAKQRLSCLRKLPAGVLANSTHWGDLNFGLDGFLLNNTPANATLYYNGPLLLGGNTEDTTCYQSTSPATPTNASGLMKLLTQYFGEDAEEVLRPYNSSISPAPAGATASQLWLNMSRDAGVSCPTLWLAHRFAKQAKQPESVYLYSFEFNATKPGSGVLHGDEVDLVWQRPPAKSVPSAREVSTHVGQYWSAFVGQGKPDTAPVEKGWPSWPSLGKDDRFLAFTDKGVGESRSNFYEAKCEAWSQYVQRGALQRQRFISFGYLC